MSMVNMVRALMKESGKNREVSRGMEISEKKKEMLQIKNTVTEMKIVHSGLISRLDIVKKKSVTLKI